MPQQRPLSGNTKPEEDILPSDPPMPYLTPLNSGPIGMPAGYSPTVPAPGGQVGLGLPATMQPQGIGMPATMSPTTAPPISPEPVDPIGMPGQGVPPISPAPPPQPVLDPSIAQALQASAQQLGIQSPQLQQAVQASSMMAQQAASAPLNAELAGAIDTAVTPETLSRPRKTLQQLFAQPIPEVPQNPTERIRFNQQRPEAGTGVQAAAPPLIPGTAEPMVAPLDADLAARVGVERYIKAIGDAYGEIEDVELRDQAMRYLNANIPAIAGIDGRTLEKIVDIRMEAFPDKEKPHVRDRIYRQTAMDLYKDQKEGKTGRDRYLEQESGTLAEMKKDQTDLRGLKGNANNWRVGEGREKAAELAGMATKAVYQSGAGKWIWGDDVADKAQGLAEDFVRGNPDTVSSGREAQIQEMEQARLGRAGRMAGESQYGLDINAFIDEKVSEYFPKQEGETRAQWIARMPKGLANNIDSARATIEQDRLAREADAAEMPAGEDKGEREAFYDGANRTILTAIAGYQRTAKGNDNQAALLQSARDATEFAPGKYQNVKWTDLPDKPLEYWTGKLASVAGEQAPIIAAAILTGPTGGVVARSLGAGKRLQAVAGLTASGTAIAPVEFEGQYEESFKHSLSQGVDPKLADQVAMIEAGTYAVMSSLLEAAPYNRFVGGMVKRKVGENLAKHFGKEILKQATAEGATELSQSMISQLARQVATDMMGIESPPIDMLQSIEEMISGMVVGGGVGIGSAASSTAQEQANRDRISVLEDLRDEEMLRNAITPEIRRTGVIPKGMSDKQFKGLSKETQNAIASKRAASTTPFAEHEPASLRKKVEKIWAQQEEKGTIGPTNVSQDAQQNDGGPRTSQARSDRRSLSPDQQTAAKELVAKRFGVAPDSFDVYGRGSDSLLPSEAPILEAVEDDLGYTAVYVDSRSDKFSFTEIAAGAEGAILDVSGKPGFESVPNGKIIVLERGNAAKYAIGLAGHEIMGHAFAQDASPAWQKALKRIQEQAPGEYERLRTEYQRAAEQAKAAGLPVDLDTINYNEEAMGNAFSENEREILGGQPDQYYQDIVDSVGPGRVRRTMEKMISFLDKTYRAVMRTINSDVAPAKPKAAIVRAKRKEEAAIILAMRDALVDATGDSQIVQKLRDKRLRAENAVPDDKVQRAEAIDRADAEARVNEQNQAAAPPDTPMSGQDLQTGDSVQWTSQGVDQFESPRKITKIINTPDGRLAQVEGSNTYLPVSELTQQPQPTETTDEARMQQEQEQQDQVDQGQDPDQAAAGEAQQEILSDTDTDAPPQGPAPDDPTQVQTDQTSATAVADPPASETQAPADEEQSEQGGVAGPGTTPAPEASPELPTTPASETDPTDEREPGRQRGAEDTSDDRQQGVAQTAIVDGIIQKKNPGRSQFPAGYTKSSIEESIKEVADTYPGRLESANDIIQGKAGDPRLNSIDGFGIDQDTFDQFSKVEQMNLAKSGVSVGDDYIVLEDVLGRDEVAAVLQEIIDGPVKRRESFAKSMLDSPSSFDPADLVRAYLFPIVNLKGATLNTMEPAAVGEFMPGTRFEIQGQAFEVVYTSDGQLVAQEQIEDSNVHLPLEGLEVMPVDEGTLELPEDVAPFSIAAYHGSRYDFDRFELSQLGTGEGHMAYGYGLYFSEVEEVADFYRKQLTGQVRDADVQGRKYKVTLAPSQDEYLDWDRPFDKQSKKVQDALRDLGVEIDPDVGAGSLYWRLSSKLLHEGSRQPTTDASLALLSKGVRGNRYRTGDSRNLNGDTPAQTIALQLIHDTGLTPDQAVKELKSRKHRSGDKAFRDRMKEAIDYIESGEYKNGVNYNYVIFDDADVTIESKFSLFNNDPAPKLPWDSTVTGLEGNVSGDLFAAQKKRDREYKAVAEIPEDQQDLAGKLNLTLNDYELANTLTDEQLTPGLVLGVKQYLLGGQEAVPILGVDIKEIRKGFEAGQANASEAQRRNRRPAEEADKDQTSLFSIAPATDAKAFDRWFKQSKVVNEDGSPKVVYHGTRSDIDGPFAFSPDAIGSANDSGFYGRGFYFTQYRGEAGYYGGNIIEAYLSLQNPLELSNDTGDYTFPGHFMSWVPKLKPLGLTTPSIDREYDAYVKLNKQVDDGIEYYEMVGRDGTEGFGAKLEYESFRPDDDGKTYTYTIRSGPDFRGKPHETREGAREQVLGELVREYEYANGRMYFTSLSDYVRTELPGGSAALTKAAKAAGYDGVHYGDEYVAFEPEQVKAVDNQGTYNPSNPDIRFSLFDSSRNNLPNDFMGNLFEQPATSPNTEPTDKEKGGKTEAPASGLFGNPDAATEEDPPPAGTPTPPGTIEDFGEKIGGARKDYAQAYQDLRNTGLDKDIMAAPLSKSWPQPNYQKLIDEGMNPEAVAFIRAARDEVPSKPRSTWKLARWSNRVEGLREFAYDVLNGKYDIADVRQRMMDKGGMEGVLGRMKLYQRVGHGKSLAGIKVDMGLYSMYDGVKHDPPKIVWRIVDKGRDIASGNTEAEAIDAFAEKYDDLSKSGTKKRNTKFILYRYNDNPKKVWVGKKIRAGVTADLKSFDTAEEARKFLKERYDDVLALWDAYRTVPDVRREGNRPRVGQDYRRGNDVTPEKFSEAFGFRGVEFGNYVEQKRRQDDLNRAFDALMDLAGVLSLDPRALSLNGELGLAFGARGKGGKKAPAAHYEPGKVVINLTKRAGPGSLAHEWWHAIDNYFGKQGGKGGFATDRSSNPAIRAKMSEAFKGIMEAIRKTDVPKRSAVADRGRKDPYFSTPTEMSARMFEDYVLHRMSEMGHSNDYLVNLGSQEAFEALMEGGWPYTEKGEMPTIAPAYERFFDTVDTRESTSPSGKPSVAMFSIRSMENLIPDLDPSMKELYAGVFGDRFNEEGYRKQSDRFTKRPTAIGRRGATGSAADLGPQRVPINGSDFPRASRQRLWAARQAFEALEKADRGEKQSAREVFADLLDPRGSVDPEAAAKALEYLPALDPAIVDAIKRLPLIDKGQEAWVYHDAGNSAVYKVISIRRAASIREDATVSGVSVGKLVGLNNAGVAPIFDPYPVSEEPVSVAQYMRDQLDPVVQGAAVYTEPVGFTADYLVLKQPYVLSAKHGWAARRESMALQLGLESLSSSGMTRLGKMPNGQHIVFVDMHKKNLVYGVPDLQPGEMIAEDAPAHLIDATARILTPEESAIIEPLGFRQQGLDSTDFSIAPRPIQYTYTDIGHGKGNDLWIMSPEGEIFTEEDDTGDQVHMVMPEAIDSPIRGWVDHDKKAISLTIGLDPMRWSQLQRDRAITSAYRQFKLLHPDYNIFEYGTQPSLTGPRFSIRKTPAGKMVETEFYQDDTLRDGMGFFSPIRDWLSKSPQKKWTKQQLQGQLKKAGVKYEEITWTGVLDWLQGKKEVTREELDAFLRQNEVRVEEVILGDGSVDESDGLRPGAEGRNGPVDVRQNEDGQWFVVDGDQVVSDELHDTRFDAENEIVDYLSEEIANGAVPPAGETKFAQYTLPGGENYRELLITLPSVESTEVDAQLDWQEATESMITAALPTGNLISIVHDDQGSSQLQVLTQDAVDVGEPQDFDTLDQAKAAAQDMVKAKRQNIIGNYRSSHFDTPNVIAHLRMNDRMDADGNRVLFLEEVQSDWGQAGRRKGYRLTEEEVQALDDRRIEIENKGPNASSVEMGEWGEIKDKLRQNSNAPPPMPYKDTSDWAGLAMKRAITYAVDNGYDAIAWTTGDQQAERYDLSKQVNEIKWQVSDKAKRVTIETSGSNLRFKLDEQGRATQDNQASMQISEMVSGKPLDEIVGKEIADKILEAEDGSLSGDGLKVGGAGMKAFYDQLLPSVAKKIGKRYGAKPGFTSVQAGTTMSVADSAHLAAARSFRDSGSSPAEAIAGMQEAYPDAIGPELRRAVDAAYSENPDVHALPITPKLRDAAKTKGMARFSIAAWHGTPYDIDRFDTEKIGTGEGAQAYGWGLYFTDKEKIADYYKDAVTRKRNRDQRQHSDNWNEIEDIAAVYDDTRAIIDKNWPGELSDMARQDMMPKLMNRIASAIDRAYEAGGDKEGAKTILAAAAQERKRDHAEDAAAFKDSASRNADMERVVERSVQDLAVAQAALNNIDRYKPRPKGRKYQVTLAPEPEELLDWDQPLSQQSPLVQDAIKEIAENGYLGSLEISAEGSGIAELMRAADDVIYDSIPRDEYTRKYQGKATQADRRFRQAVYEVVWNNNTLTKGDGFVTWDQIIDVLETYKGPGADAALDYTRKIKEVATVKGVSVTAPAWFNEDDATGQRVYRKMSRSINQEAASHKLKKHGVRGIRYLDGSSRNSPQQYRVTLDKPIPEDKWPKVGGFDGQTALNLAINEIERSLSDHDGDVTAAVQQIRANGKMVAQRHGPSEKVFYNAVADMLAAGEVTIKDNRNYNYVIFDDADVQIDAKFSLRNPNVRQGFELSELSKWGQLRRAAQDKFLVIKNLQKALKSQGGVVDPSMDVYQMEELFPGKVGRDLQQFERTMMNDLIHAIKDSGIDIERLGILLVARHAEEANNYIDKINPEFRADLLKGAVAGSGMPTDIANKIIEESKASGEWKKALPVFRVHDDINNARLDLIEQAGLEPAEKLRKVKARYKFYTPLRGHKGVTIQDHDIERLGGVKLQDEDPVKPRRTLGFDARGKELERRYGRVSLPENPIVSTVMMMRNTIIHARQNEVGQAFLKLVRANPDPDMWEENKLYERYYFDERVGQVKRQKYDQAKYMDEHNLVVVENGQQVWVHINNDDVARAMKSLGPKHNHVFIRGMATLTRYFTAINTQWSPEFIPTNFFRDMQTASIHLAGEIDGKFARDTMLDIRKAMLAVLQANADDRRLAKGKSAKTRKPNQVEWLRWWEEFQEAGGKIEFFGLKDFDNQTKDLLKKIDRLNESGGKAFVRGTLRGMATLVSDTNNAVENAARLAAYKQARLRGWSKADAASLARNLTVNFNRKGESAAMLGALYAFFNAAVQGNTRLLTSLHKSPRTRAIAAGITVMSAGLALLNYLIAGEDDDGVNYWAKIDQNTKSRNAILMTPWAGEGTYLKLPLPYGYNIFHAAGTNTVDTMTGVQSPTQAAGGMAVTIMDSFNPIGNSATLLQQFTPTVAEPFVQYAENTAWHGGPIRPVDIPGDNRPDSQKYFSSVSESSRWAAKFLNDITGGDDMTKGLIDVSPEAIDHGIDSAFGSVGSFFRRTTSLGIKLFKGDEIESREVPFLRKVFGTTSEYIAVGDFNSYRRKLSDYDRRLRYYERSGYAGKAEKLREEQAKWFELKPEIDTVNQEQKALQERIDVLKDLPSSTEGKIDVLEEVRRQFAMPYNVRQTSIGDLAMITQDLEQAVQMDNDSLDAYIKQLETERMDMIKAMNKKIRETTGEANRPVPR